MNKAESHWKIRNTVDKTSSKSRGFLAGFSFEVIMSIRGPPQASTIRLTRAGNTGKVERRRGVAAYAVE